MAINLYTGTPGSGKSLHLADKIYHALLMKRHCIVNFPVSIPKNLKHREKYLHYLDNSDLTVDYLVKFSFDLMKKTGKYIPEDSILCIIDECQIMFNCREWGKSDRADWLKFFTQHRKFGYHIILVAQYDGMVDKQLRSLIEYQFIHRKVSNFGWRGILLCALMLSPRLFVAVQVWYPMKETVGSEFFKFHRRYASMYDTHSLFDIFDEKEDNIDNPLTLELESEVS